MSHLSLDVPSHSRVHTLIWSHSSLLKWNTNSPPGDCTGEFWCIRICFINLFQAYAVLTELDPTDHHHWHDLSLARRTLPFSATSTKIRRQSYWNPGMLYYVMLHSLFLIFTFQKHKIGNENLKSSVEHVRRVSNCVRFSLKYDLIYLILS